MSESKDESNSEQQARAQYKSVCAMVAALECDYDRLEELRDERAGYEIPEDAREHAGDMDTEASRALWAELNTDEALELAELKEAAGDCEDQDAARQVIEEDALSVEVRSDWHTPGSDDNEAAEFRILLCTGGPAVQIRGELQDGEPCRAWLEHQDWGTPWTQFIGWHDDKGEWCRVSQDTLLSYARVFYFGEG